MAASNGNGPSADDQENRHFLREEREPESPYVTPPVVWQGPWQVVADILQVYDWRVWIGVTAALSARAHRNIHVNYHGSLFGMGAYLLVAPSGVGKSLATGVCRALLPHDFNMFDSIESGQALAERMADIERDTHTKKIVRVTPRPSIIVTSEWTQLIKAVDIAHSNLFERINKAVDGEESIDLNRAKEAIHVPAPSLTVLGTTTRGNYEEYVQQTHIRSGLMNRHFILPTERRRWLYNDPHAKPDYQAIVDYGAAFRVGYTFGNGTPLADLYTNEAYEYDNRFGESFLAPIRNSDTIAPHIQDLLGRLHVYLRRIAMLYAWAHRSAYITLAHVQAAEAAVRTSHQFLMEMEDQRSVELPPHMKATSAIEEKILARVTAQPGITQRQLCQALYRNGGHVAVKHVIDNLVHCERLLRQTEGHKIMLRVAPSGEGGSL
jgi:hypothetical protein